MGFVVSHGPIYLDRVFFDDFVTNDVHKSMAIGFKLDNDRISDIDTQIKDIRFGYDDTVSTISEK